MIVMQEIYDAPTLWLKVLNSTDRNLAVYALKLPYHKDFFQRYMYCSVVQWQRWKTYVCTLQPTIDWENPYWTKEFAVYNYKQVILQFVLYSKKKWFVLWCFHAQWCSRCPVLCCCAIFYFILFELLMFSLMVMQSLPCLTLLCQDPAVQWDFPVTMPVRPHPKGVCATVHRATSSTLLTIGPVKVSLSGHTQKGVCASVHCCC